MKTFYVYGIYVQDKLVYIGKGHDDSETGYSRSSHYLMDKETRSHFISAGVHSKLCELEDASIKPEVRKLHLVDSEAAAFDLEESLVDLLKPEWNARRGGPNSGSTLSDESKLAMSCSRIGKKMWPLSDKAKSKISDAHKGRSLSDEHRRKISEGVKNSSRRDEIIFPDAIVEERRQSHNSALSTAQEVEIIRSSTGLTASEIKSKIEDLVQHPVSTTLVYHLINRYGGKKEKVTRQETVRKSIERRREKSIDRIKEKGVDNVQLEYGTNREVWVVHGVSCSGKTWVCSHLRDEGLAYYSAFDRADRWIELKRATHQPLPIVFDPLRNAVAVASKNPELKVHFVVIIEDESVILSRAVQRNAELNLDKLKSRMARAQSIARVHAEFRGTSSEVLAFLRSKLGVTR